jgi:hypothetical protein
MSVLDQYTQEMDEILTALEDAARIGIAWVSAESVMADVPSINEKLRRRLGVPVNDNDGFLDICQRLRARKVN